MRDDAQLLLRLAEDDNDALLALQAAGDVDVDMRLTSGGSQGEGKLDEAEGVEARVDDLVLDGGGEGKALAVVVADVLGDEIVEVVGGGTDLADLVAVLVDEVAGGNVLEGVGNMRKGWVMVMLMQVCVCV